MKKAKGGSIEMAGGNPSVMAAAKKGKDIGKIDGAPAPQRLDRARRASGGRVGADTNPYSSAHKK